MGVPRNEGCIAQNEGCGARKEGCDALSFGRELRGTVAGALLCLEQEGHRRILYRNSLWATISQIWSVLELRARGLCYEGET